MEQKDKQARLSIGDLSRLSGVNSITLRAWERRYGLLKPQRSPGGHRLYSQGDVERIQQVQLWLQKGVAVGQVKALLENSSVSTVVPASDMAFQAQQQRLIEPALALNAQACQQQLMQLSRDLPWREMVNHVLQPVFIGLQQQKALAALSVLENELQAWFAWRLRNQHKQKRDRSVLLVLGEHTQAWPLLLQASLLLDSAYKVELMLLVQDLDISLSLLQHAKHDNLILYQDAKFKMLQQQAVEVLLQQHKNLYLAGGAGVLAGLKPKRRVWGHLDKLVHKNFLVQVDPPE